MNIRYLLVAIVLVSFSCSNKSSFHEPEFSLTPSTVFFFNSFVDCNMAEAWIGDTFRIFPGKYGEDPLWGDADDLKFADGRNADEAFLRNASEFQAPALPLNTKPGTSGLHGAVWFETVYQDPSDASGKTLYAVYHNENYPVTLPYDAATEKGYIDHKWPEGLTGDTTPAAVCRIGIMKSIDGGRKWEDKGIFIEDNQPRMILKPHNTSVTFAGGVGDPSAVASGDYLYLFYGEYGYPGLYDSTHYDPVKEWSGQCISMARIALDDLDNPSGKAKRWDGNGFNAGYDGIGKPVASIQIQVDSGGGPASHPSSKYHWGPSVSWNTYLNCWVMLMARAEGPKWQGGNIYISFNPNADLGEGNNSQQWTKPKLLLSKPGVTIWYPSLQPTNNATDVANKATCLKLGRTARLFYKVNAPDKAQYLSEYTITFK